MTMTLSAMTFHESYGDLPTALLTRIRKYNISPADYDAILRAFGHVWSDHNINWPKVIEFVDAHSKSGTYRPSRWL